MIRIAVLSVTAALLAVAPALAQEPARGAPDLAPPDARPLTPEESVQLAAALQFDPAVPGAAPALRTRSLARPGAFAVTRNAQPDGASTYTLKRTLPNLNTSIGADLGTGAAPVNYYEPDRPIAAAARNSGAAWASVSLSSLASVDARVDPTADQGRLATTLHHAVPLGRNVSLTLQNTSGLTDTRADASVSAPAGLPMMTLPQSTAASGSEVWDDQPSVKVDLHATGTSFTAGLARTSTDPVTHNHFGADQTIYGPLHLSTAISDVGEVSENKSVSAGLKFNW